MYVILSSTPYQIFTNFRILNLVVVVLARPNFIIPHINPTIVAVFILEVLIIALLGAAANLLGLFSRYQERKAVQTASKFENFKHSLPPVQETRGSIASGVSTSTFDQAKTLDSMEKEMGIVTKTIGIIGEKDSIEV